MTMTTTTLTTTTLTKTPKRATILGRPGSLEMIVVTTWTSKYSIGWIRVKGWYDVFCGNGGTHRVAIDERSWTSDYVGEDVEDVATALIEESLYDWSDPCSAAEAR
jgi:hypothetical protein